MEEWKQITDFPKYEVSNNGQIRNSKGQILKAQANTKNNYFQVLLWKDSKAKCCYVHRLVAEAFVPKEKDTQIYVWFKDENVQKAIVRGALLGGGSINNPENKYHDLCL